MKIARIFLIMCLCFAAGEIFVRIADTFKLTGVEVLPVKSMKHYKETQEDFQPSDEVRVLLLGDSLFAGLGVEEGQYFSEVLSKNLQEKLPGKRVRVIDEMLWGYNTYRKWQVFERYMSRPEKPNVIFYDYSLGDVDGGFPELGEAPVRSSLPGAAKFSKSFFSKAGLLADHSMLVRYLKPRIRLFLWRKGIVARPSLMWHLIYDAYEADWPGWQATQKYLDRMNTKSRENGVIFVLHRAPDFLLYPDDPYGKAVRTLSEFCLSHQIPLVDSSFLFRGYSGKELSISPIDSHPSALAHQIVAKYAASWIAGEEKHEEA